MIREIEKNIIQIITELQVLIDETTIDRIHAAIELKDSDSIEQIIILLEELKDQPGLGMIQKMKLNGLIVDLRNLIAYDEMNSETKKQLVRVPLQQIQFQLH